MKEIELDTRVKCTADNFHYGCTGKVVSTFNNLCKVLFDRDADKVGKLGSELFFAYWYYMHEVEVID